MISTFEQLKTFLASPLYKDYLAYKEELVRGVVDSLRASCLTQEDVMRQERLKGEADGFDRDLFQEMYESRKVEQQPEGAKL